MAQHFLEARWAQALATCILGLEAVGDFKYITEYVHAGSFLQRI